MNFKTFLRKIGIDEKETNLEFINYKEKDIINKLKNCNSIVIWGASSGGQKILNFLEKNNINVNYFVDSDYKKWGKKINRYEIKNPDSLSKEDCVLIGSMYQKDIILNLKERNINNFICNLFDFCKFINPIALEFDINILLDNLDLLYDFYKILDDEESKDIFKYLILYLANNPLKIKESLFPQYFHPLIKPENNDIIVDAGAYIGDTLEEIIKQNIAYKKIYAFEPDEQNYAKLIENTKTYQNIEAYKYGLWDIADRLYFSAEANMGSSITTDISKANQTIDTLSLDEFFKDKKKPTLIKMDIEGAELNALLGAKEIITNYKPKLQICIYHKPEHLYQIPLLIKDLVPEYKLYLGHHIQTWADTVLYAKV
jgi:FkbM family methyltransferase